MITIVKFRKSFSTENQRQHTKMNAQSRQQCFGYSLRVRPSTRGRIGMRTKAPEDRSPWIKKSHGGQKPSCKIHLGAFVHLDIF